MEFEHLQSSAQLLSFTFNILQTKFYSKRASSAFLEATKISVVELPGNRKE
jgi:hypothetical protein